MLKLVLLGRSCRCCTASDCNSAGNYPAGMLAMNPLPQLCYSDPDNASV